MQKTKLHREKEAAFQEAEPNQFGNLHERVKFLSALALEAYNKHADIFHAHPALERLRNAIFDLESEAALNDCDIKSRAAGKRKAFLIQY